MRIRRWINPAYLPESRMESGGAHEGDVTVINLQKAKCIKEDVKMMITQNSLAVPETSLSINQKNKW